MGLQERLNILVEYSHLSIRAFANKCGLKQQTLDRYVKGKAEPMSSYLIAIAKTFPEISCEWLLLGEGMMLKEDNQADRLNKLLGTIEVLQDSINAQKDTIAVLRARNAELETKLKNQ